MAVTFVATGISAHWWNRLGCGHYVGATATNQRVDQFVVPCYFVVVIAGLLAPLPVASKYSSISHYSLRTLLIAASLVAVALGFVVAISPIATGSFAAVGC
jgi:hypothetical protein